jgi:hypothetical protein
MKLGVVALLLSATMVIGIAVFESRALFPAPSHATAEGIVWHGRTFVTRREFARWLRARGTTYAAWARRHPSLAGVRAGHGGQKSSDWSARNVGGGLALLAGIGLVLVFVRRRWPDRLEAAIDAVRFGLESAMDAVLLAGRRAGPPAKEGARALLRWARLAALLTARKAESWARIICSRGFEFARAVARRVAPVAKREARLILALATAMAVSTWRLSASAGKRGALLMLGLATAIALQFSSRAAPAGKRRARPPHLSSSLTESAAKAIRRRRGELVWYLATAVVATGVGVLATVWLNRA